MPFITLVLFGSYDAYGMSQFPLPTNYIGLFKPYSVIYVQYNNEIVCETERNNGHYLDTPFVISLHFRVSVERWRFLIFVHNVPKVHKNQPHLQFGFPIIKVLSIGLVMV
jgi:hypothetical protein